MGLVTLRNMLWVALLASLLLGDQSCGWPGRLWRSARNEARFWAVRKRWLLALLVLSATNTLGLSQHLAQGRQVEIGAELRPAMVALRNVHEPEQDAAGAYRWTGPESDLVIRGVIARTCPLLTFGIGSVPEAVAAPRTIHMLIAGAPVLNVPIAPVPRYYSFTLPASTLDGRLVLRIASDTFSIPPDTRALGIRSEAVGLAWPTGFWGLPTWPAFLAECITALAALALIRRVPLSRPARGLSAGGLLLLLGWMTGWGLYLDPLWPVRLSLAGILVLRLCWVAVRLSQAASSGLR